MKIIATKLCSNKINQWENLINPQKQYFESIRMILCEMIVLRTTFHLRVL